MSGNGQPDDEQPRGEQQPSGRQPQGNRRPQCNQRPQGNQQPRGTQQPQGSQQPQGGRQPNRQGGQPPQGGGGGGLGGGLGGGINTDSVRRIAVFGVAALALAGLVFGLSPVIAGFAGSSPTDTVPANSTAAQNQAENTSEANDIVSEALSDTNLSAANAYERMQYQNGIIGTVVGLAPYFGFLLALGIGLLAGIRFDIDEKNLAAGVAVTALVGLVLFTVLSSAVAGFQYNSMSTTDWENQYDTNPNQWNGPGGYPAGDMDGTAQAFQDANVTASAADIGGSTFQGRISTISALQLSYGTLVINSFGFGLVAALGAAGLAVVGRRFSE